MITWVEKPFDELTPAELYAALEARQAVFVIEQSCIYPDIDRLDAQAVHLLGTGDDGALLAYLRILPPGAWRFDEPSLGRILTAGASRGTGLGKRLMHEGLARIARRYPGRPTHIAAQSYLDRFYRSFGFEPCGDTYLEDGIPHRDMVRPC